MFRHRITFQEPNETQDPYSGAVEVDWVTVFENVPAAIEFRSVREAVGGAQIQVTTAISDDPMASRSECKTSDRLGDGRWLPVLQYHRPCDRQADQQFDRRDPGRGAGVMLVEMERSSLAYRKARRDLGGQGPAEVHAAPALHRGLADP